MIARVVKVPLTSIEAAPAEELRTRASRLKSCEVLALYWSEDVAPIDTLVDFHGWLFGRDSDEGYAILHINPTMEQLQQFGDALATMRNRTAIALSDGGLRLLGHYRSIHTQILDTMRSGNDFTVDELAVPLAERLTRGSLGNELKFLAESHVLLRRRRRRSKRWYYSLPWEEGLCHETGSHSEADNVEMPPYQTRRPEPV